MHAPLEVVTLHDGSVEELSSLYDARPLMLVFLRHSGCIFCREQVALTREKPEWNIAFVTMSPVAEAKALKERMDSPHPFISDPNKTLYQAFGLQRGSFAQMFNPTTFRRGFSATLAGHTVGKPIGDPWQLSGTFLINEQGLVVREHRSGDAADNLTLAQMGEWLLQPV